MAARSVWRDINRLAVIHAIQKNGLISQSEVTRITRLSPSTVLRITRKLVAEGLVVVRGKDQSSGGRRPVLLTFNSTAGFVVGVDLGGSHMVGALSDLSGQILHVQSVPTPSTDGSEAVLSALYATIEGLLERTSIPTEKIRAIGVGAPGVTRSNSGIVVHAPALGWRDVPLRELLEERFGVPTLVENDANMIALGELWFGAAQGARNVVSIVIGTGIGAGVIIQGDLYRGAREAAGEIGFAIFDEKFLGISYREFGCLETFAAGPGIARRARHRIGQGRARKVLSIAGQADLVSAEHVFAAARADDADAVELVNETADALAVAIINISAVLDPDVVVLGGGVMRSGDLMIDRIRERMSHALVETPPVVKSELGDDATVKGAIARALAADPKHPFALAARQLQSAGKPGVG